MSVQPYWKARLVDAATLEHIEDFDDSVMSRSFNPLFNLPGAFNSTMPIDCPLALAVQKHSTAVMIERNKKPVWSGPVFSIVDQSDGDSGTTQVTAMGWMEEINRRILYAEDEPFTAFNTGTQTGGEIAFELLERLSLRELSDGSIAPIRVSPGVRTDTQARQRVYTRGQNVGQAIMELVNIENGMDIWVDPVSRLLNTKPPSEFEVKNDVQFGHRIEPFNLSSVGVQDDGTQTVNSYIASGDKGIYIEGIDDVDAVNLSGVLLEETIALSDVSDSNIVIAYALSELAFYRRGGVTLSIKPKYLPQGGDVYRLYEHFFLGDQIYFSADHGRMQYRHQPVRVFGASLEFDAEGNEVLSELQVVGSGGVLSTVIGGDNEDDFENFSLRLPFTLPRSLLA